MLKGGLVLILELDMNLGPTLVSSNYVNCNFDCNLAVTPKILKLSF